MFKFDKSQLPNTFFKFVPQLRKFIIMLQGVLVLLHTKNISVTYLNFGLLNCKKSLKYRGVNIVWNDIDVKTKSLRSERLEKENKNKLFLTKVSLIRILASFQMIIF